MSGIAPGSYLAYGIGIPESVRNDIVSGTKRERPEDELGNGSTASKSWRSTESIDSLKAVSRSKYKCSLCGQAKKGHVCMVQKTGNGQSPWKDTSSQANGCQNDFASNRQALVQKLQERLGKRQDGGGGDRSGSANHPASAQQLARGYGGSSYEPPPPQAVSILDLSHTDALPHDASSAQLLSFDPNSSAFDGIEVFDGRGPSASGQQFLTGDDDPSPLEAVCAAAGAADGFMLSFGDVPPIPLSPPIVVTPGAAAGSSLLPFTAEGGEALATPAAVCGPQSGGLVPFPPEGFAGGPPGVSPPSAYLAAAFPDPPAAAAGAAGGGAKPPPTSAAASAGGRAAGGVGPKWPCGPLRFLDRSADAAPSAPAAAAAAGKGVASAGGASASPSFQLHSPSPLISSQTMAAWGAVEEPAPAPAPAHTPAHVRPQSTGLPSPGGADWLLGLTGGVRTPGLWTYLCDSAFAAASVGGGSAGSGGGGGGGGGFSLGPTMTPGAAAAAAAAGGLEGLWSAAGGRERSVDGAALLGGLAALARTPTVARTPGSGSGGSGSGGSAQEGFWSGLLTPSATSPQVRPAGCDGGGGGSGAPSPRLPCGAGGPPPPLSTSPRGRDGDLPDPLGADRHAPAPPADAGPAAAPAVPAAPAVVAASGPAGAAGT